MWKVLLLLPSLSFAAPHVADQNTLKVLLDSEQMKEVRQLGPAGYRGLRQMMFSPVETMKSRWQATMAVAKLGGMQSLPELKRALKDSQWYMRSAALVALQSIDSKKAIKEAKKLLHKDKAMMVRASALQVLKRSKGIDRRFLWKELNNKVNYFNGKSLSFRTTIVNTLGESPRKKELARFVRLLRDQDQRVQQAAQEGLETIARRLGAVQIPTSHPQWVAWGRRQKMF